MMRPFIAWIALACCAWAQAAPAPAEELARYDRLLGSWESNGTATMGPGAEMQWTANTHTRKVLDGHFVRADTRIDFGEGAPGALGFITFYGWDPEKGEHVFYEVSNMGAVRAGEIVWLGDDAMMTMSAHQTMGQHMLERWITRFEGDSHSFVGEEAVDDGPWQVHVRGTAKKRTSEKPVSVADLEPFMVSQGNEMERAVRMAGHYDLDGSFRFMPGQAMTDITGHEAARPIFGGTVLEFEATGQPGDWHGYSFLAYDADAGHYRMFGLNNMGMAHENQGYFQDGTWIFTSTGTFQGEPSVGRMILWTDDSGQLTKANAHALFGTADPYLSFEATYSMADEVHTRPASAGRSTGSDQ